MTLAFAVGADQHLHSFLGGKGLGSNMEASVGVGLPKPAFAPVQMMA